MKLKHTPSSHPISNLLLRFLVTRSDRGGFTLIELLVSMIISSLVVSGLLYLVVEILGVNQRDASRSDTQRDLQMAMDYIARDVREATYVYGVTQATKADGTLDAKESCLYAYSDALVRGQSGKCTGLLRFLPPALIVDDPIKGGNYPVLAFWKPESLPSTMRSACKTNAQNVGKSSNEPGYNAALNSIPCVSQRMYTLVVYSLNTQNSGIWRGKARITRYQLPNFLESAVIAANSVNSGWAAPIAKDKRPLTWPVGDKTDSATNVVTTNVNVQNGTPATDPNFNRPTLNMVLTDFVDFKTDAASTTYRQGYCPSGFDSPSGFSGARFNSAFYVCVRSGSLSAQSGASAATVGVAQAAAAAGQGLNPEVNIVMRGNAAGQGGIPLLSGDVPFQMETRVLSRGVYGKLSN